jgi:SAM-dependent methyltransferase
MGLKEQILSMSFFKNWKRSRQKAKFRGSEKYWEERYHNKGNSGQGSYDQLAEGKAEILNDFVQKHNIKTVMEFGCGDGNQLRLAKYPQYLGLDVSPTAVKICYNLFKTDLSKSFYVYNTMAFVDNARLFKADLSMSLDVLYHLVEKEIFENYLRHLFASADRYVIIYATDFDQKEEPVYQHENRRSFTGFIGKNIPGWKLKEIIKNKYPYEKYGEKGSKCDFFVYERSAG